MSLLSMTLAFFFLHLAHSSSENQVKQPKRPNILQDEKAHSDEILGNALKKYLGKGTRKLWSSVSGRGRDRVVWPLRATERERERSAFSHPCARIHLFISAAMEDDDDDDGQIVVSLITSLETIVGRTSTKQMQLQREKDMLLSRFASL